MRETDFWLSSLCWVVFDFGVDVGMKLLDVGVRVLATQLRGVLDAESFKPAFFGGVENRSVFASKSS